MKYKITRNGDVEIMQNNNKRDYSKKNYLRNGSKSQGQYAKNSFNTSIEEPGINESGEIAKKNGF